MKYAEIKHLQEVELRKRLAQTKQALFDARMKHKMQRLSNIMDLRSFKKDIAKLETALAKLPKKEHVKVAKTTTALNTKPKTKEVTQDPKLHNTTDKTLSEVKKESPIKSQNRGTKQDLKPSKEQSQKTTETKKERVTKSELNTKQENKKLDKSDSSKKRMGQKTLGKTKKWFGFLGSGSSIKNKKPAGKQNFFRRKSGP